MPTFEEWREMYEGFAAIPDLDGDAEEALDLALRSAYAAGGNQATFAANNRAGDSANEGEKAARRKEAVEALLIISAYDLDPERIRAIIEKAQG